MHKKRNRIMKDINRFWLVEVFESYKDKIKSNKNPKIMHLACKVCADYSLLRQSDDKWICTCVTCWVKKHWSDPNMQRGHFVKQGDSNFYRFTEDNIFPQCMSCNVMNHGNYKIYTLFMQHKFWLEWVETRLKDKTTKSYKNWELAEMIEKWREYLINDNRYK